MTDKDRAQLKRKVKIPKVRTRGGDATGSLDDHLSDAGLPAASS